MYIYTDDRSDVDMLITFKDTNNERHIRRIFHYAKKGVHYVFHPIVWISNQSMVAGATTKLLSEKDLVHKVQ
jgi:hypothetical protein